LGLPDGLFPFARLAPLFMITSYCIQTHSILYLAVIACLAVFVVGYNIATWFRRLKTPFERRSVRDHVKFHNSRSFAKRKLSNSKHIREIGTTITKKIINQPPDQPTTIRFPRHRNATKIKPKKNCFFFEKKLFWKLSPFFDVFSLLSSYPAPNPNTGFPFDRHETYNRVTYVIITDRLFIFIFFFF